jgi:hypothetical protein
VTTIRRIIETGRAIAPSPDADADVVALLERLLRDARAGHITGIAVGAMRSGALVTAIQGVSRAELALAAVALSAGALESR